MLDSMRRFKAGIFQALAHPTRVAIVEYLQQGELSVGQLCEKVGATFNYVSQQQGRQVDFKEYVVDFKLQLPWEKFVTLLEELHNSREFLKLIRLNIASQYEREDRMDVDLRVSTIEFDPQRTGTK